MKNSYLLVALLSAMACGCVAVPVIEGDERADLPNPEPQTGTRLARRSGVDNGLKVETITEEEIEEAGVNNVEDLLRGQTTVLY